MAKLLLEIVTPEAKTFSEEVDMVVLPGVEGELASAVARAVDDAASAGGSSDFPGGKETGLVVGTGFVEVSQTHVSILTDMAMADTEIDEAAAEEAVKRAEARVRDKDLNSEEVSEIEGSIARSLAQLKFKEAQTPSLGRPSTVSDFNASPIFFLSGRRHSCGA